MPSIPTLLTATRKTSPFNSVNPLAAWQTSISIGSREAIELALDFLPDTQAIFGRNAKTSASHMLYVSDLHKTEKVAALAFKKYVGGKPGPVVVELRTGGNGKGALSVFPPSMHHGETVMWVRSGEPAKIAGDELKRAVLLLAMASVLAPAYPEPGSRHEAALVLGGVLARADFDAAAIAHLMRVLTRDARDEEANARVNDAVSALTLKAEGRELPGLPRLAEVWGKDIADTLGKWLQAERKFVVGAGGFEDTIALQFAELHSDDYRFVAKSSQWLHWNGGRWREEATYAAFDLSRGLCRGAGKAGDARAKTVNGVVTLARTDRRIAATTDQWDRAIRESAIHQRRRENMTIELSTGIDRPPRREDYCTKQTAVAPAEPGVPCDLWLTFLDRITNKDDELIGFLQRWLGYCLSGYVHEHVMVFLYGTGANGKGVFTFTVAGIFGDYCVTVPVEMLIEAALRPASHRDRSLARCVLRLALAQETQQGRRWDEAKIKNLTGADRLTARFMRGDFFDFDPSHKLMVSGNHKPSLRLLMRRRAPGRLLLVPCVVTIPEPGARSAFWRRSSRPSGRRFRAGWSREPPAVA